MSDFQREKIQVIFYTIIVRSREQFIVINQDRFGVKKPHIYINMWRGS